MARAPKRAIAAAVLDRVERLLAAGPETRGRGGEGEAGAVGWSDPAYDEAMEAAIAEPRGLDERP